MNPTLSYQSSARHTSLRDVLPLYVIESMATVGGTLMSIGIFFYMKYRFGWQMPQNFMLAAAQGIVYIPAALLAGPVVKRLGTWRTLGGVYAILAVLTGAAAWMAASGREGSALAVAAALLAYTFAIGISWPILEGLVASAGAPAGIAHRIATYNVIWPAGGAIAIAVEGTILKYWVTGLFLLPGIMHALSLVIVWLQRHQQELENDATPQHAPHVEPEPELLRKRKLALWLSRTALPATYTVIYGLMPMMPSLTVMQHLPETKQTLVASVWLMTRWLAFVLLAMGSWWHTRPRALLWAAVIMLVAFFGMIMPPTHGASQRADLISMIAWQAVLGLAIGMIYSGSLYFGMVLSEGSTEHGGYHEALIGVGWVIGPAAGAGAQFLNPTNMWLGIGAVGSVIAATVLVVLATAVVMSRARANE